MFALIRLFQRAIHANVMTIMALSGTLAAPMLHGNVGRVPAIPPDDVLKLMEKELIEEAQRFQETGVFEKTEPDYAQRFRDAYPKHVVPMREVLVRIVTRKHRDPFVDAYIRWQLTDFDPALPDLNDHSFLRLMQAAPPLLQNPRADAGVVGTLERAEQSGPIAPEHLAQLRRAIDELEDRTVRTEAFNRAAFGYRAWIAKQLGETGRYPRQWMLEELRATILAGWSVSTLKRRITANFTDSVDDESFSARDRQIVLEQAQAMRDLERRYFREITYYASNAVNVTFGTSSVTNANIDRWHKRLLGIPD